MSTVSQKKHQSLMRSRRVRARMSSTTERPRLSVHISNYHVSAQIIDDSKSVTLAAASTVGQKASGTMTEKAAFVGEQIGKNAKKAKVGKVVFDRGSKLYHGRIKALADAARKAGLEF